MGMSYSLYKLVMDIMVERMLNDENSKVRLEAAEALDKIGVKDLKVVEGLVKALRDKDEHVRLQVR